MKWNILNDVRPDAERPLQIYVKERTKYDLKADERCVEYTTTGYVSLGDNVEGGYWWSIVIPYRPFVNTGEPFSQGCMCIKAVGEDFTDFCERPDILFREVWIVAWKYTDDDVPTEFEVPASLKSMREVERRIRRRFE